MNPPTLKTALGIFIPTLFIYLFTYSAPRTPRLASPLSPNLSPLRIHRVIDETFKAF